MSYGVVTKYLKGDHRSRSIVGGLPDTKYEEYLGKIMGGVDLLAELGDIDDSAHLTNVVIGGGWGGDDDGGEALNAADASTLEPAARLLFIKEIIGGASGEGSDTDGASGEGSSAEEFVGADIPPLEHATGLAFDGSMDEPAARMSDVGDEILYNCPFVKYPIDKPILENSAVGPNNADSDFEVAKTLDLSVMEPTSEVFGAGTVLDNALITDETDDEMVGATHHVGTDQREKPQDDILPADNIADNIADTENFFGTEPMVEKTLLEEAVEN